MEAPQLPAKVEELLGKRPTTRELKSLSKDDAFAIADTIHGEILSRVKVWKQIRIELAQYIWVAINVEIGGKTVWQWKGCSSPQEYFAIPEAMTGEGIDIGWRMIQRYERVHGVYPIGLGLLPEEYQDISTDKLEILIPVVYDEYHRKPKVSRMEAHRWLAIAQGFSRSDLRERVQEHFQQLIQPPPQSTHNPANHIDEGEADEPAWVPPPDLDALHAAFGNAGALKQGGRLFERFVRQGTCILYGREKNCQKKPVTIHHWPKTVGAGAGPGMGIPLCPRCHADKQNDYLLWEDHGGIIMEYLYSTIHCLLEILNEQAKSDRRRSRLAKD